MKKLTHLVLAVSLWSALALNASAQSQVLDPAGFKMTVPSEYQIQQNAEGTVCSDGTSMIVIKNHQFQNFESFAAQAGLARDGFTLVGEVRALNATDRHFRASKPNPGGGYLIADTFVRFSPYGGGCLVVALASSEEAEGSYYAGHNVANSVQFQAQSATGGGGAWEQALRGKHLVYLYTGNGYSERFDIYLLANGAFIARSDMSSLSLNGSGVAAGGGDGRWQITPSGQLYLNHHNGKQQSYQLAPRQASNEVSLNGKRYFVMSE